MNYFFSCHDQITDKKQPKRIDSLGSQFECIAHHGKEGMVDGVEAVGHRVYSQPESG